MLESFIKDWTAVLYESVAPDVAKIIVQHVVKAEELVQPKLRMEEGQAPSFLELAERLATVVSGCFGVQEGGGFYARQSISQPEKQGPFDIINFLSVSQPFLPKQVKQLPSVPPLQVPSEASASDAAPAGSSAAAPSPTAESGKSAAPVKNGMKPTNVPSAESSSMEAGQSTSGTALPSVPAVPAVPAALDVLPVASAAAAAANPAGPRDPSSMPILHRLGCSSEEADAFAATLTSQLEQAGVMFTSPAPSAKDAGSVVRVVDRTGFPLWFKISPHRPLGRLMRTYGQLKVGG